MGGACAGLVERVYRQAAEIGVRLEDQRRYRAHQHGLGDTLGVVAPDVASNLSVARLWGNRKNSTWVVLTRSV